jgi:hypothetical protein
VFALLLAVLVGVVAVVRRPRLSGPEVWRQAALGLLCRALYLAGVVAGMGVPAGIAG